jgi:hypothetical protein
MFAIKPYDIKRMRILIDGDELGGDIFAYEHDIFFQACTRGGRKMDSILKGQAQFKQATADVAAVGMQTSQNIMNAANQQAMSNPGTNTSGAAMVAGAVMLASLCFAIASAAANPTADIRHWGLLPNDIFILPCSLSSGKHELIIECYDKNNTLKENRKFDIEVKADKKGDNVFFARVF